MRHRGILLDLDNTLYPYEKAHTPALDAAVNCASEKFSISPDEILKRYNQGREQIHIEHSGTASSHNRLLYFQRLFELININPLVNALELYNVYWDTFIENMVPYDGVYDFLEYTNGKNTKICFITDLTAHIQHKKITTLNLNNYTDCLVTSEEAGREKPHPYIFLLALKKINMTASEVVMVGDNFEKDVIGATNLGINSYWLCDHNPGLVHMDLIKPFSSFKQLLGYFS